MRDEREKILKNKIKELQLLFTLYNYCSIKKKKEGYVN